MVVVFTIVLFATERHKTLSISNDSIPFDLWLKLIHFATTYTFDYDKLHDSTISFHITLPLSLSILYDTGGKSESSLSLSLSSSFFVKN